EDPRPHVQLRNFGPSGLELNLCVWIQSPRFRDDVIDNMNNRIYKALVAAKIEIPYSRHDLFLKDLPALQALLAAQQAPGASRTDDSPA
ncbi:MAG TPA: hypothetical protein VGB85_09305, partial [Nannocystis sp.]